VRALRYALLGILVALTLGALAIFAAGQLRALATEKAASLSGRLARELRAFREHAVYLARRDEVAMLSHLGSFHGLARVERFDPSGSLRFQAERFGDLVATVPPERLDERKSRLPPAGAAVEISGFRVDPTRKDVHPSLRTTIEYAARAEDGGTLVLTVYAEPFLRPIREAGAWIEGDDGATPLGRPGEGSSVSVAGDRWRLHHPLDLGLSRLALPLALGCGVLLLAAGAVLLSERQIRAQEQAAIEARLAQAERLSTLGLLSAGVAHEINNPLEGIFNWLRLNNVEKAREGLERIRKIARDLLQYARPRGVTESAEVSECVARSLELARFSRDFRDVATEVTIAAPLVAALPAHALEQVFLNLMLNAGAAMRGSGRLRISGEREGAKVRVRFRDSGPGIAAGDLGRIFDPFFSRSGGTGLGLSVSHGILRNAGGDLLAANADGGGALFTVEVPAR